MRRWIVFGLALALGFMGATPAVAARGAVTIVLGGEPDTMDPHADSSFIGAIVWRWSYDTLISSETGTGKYVPWLAEKWERLSPTAVKFWLRKGAKFSDGAPVNSEAVKYSMDRVLDPELKSRQRPYFNEYDRIEVLDDHSFIWHSKVPDNALINRLTRWGYVISPKVRGVDRTTISRNSFGSGPYVIKSWTKGQRMVLEANPTWWGNDKYPNRPQTIILRRIQEASTRVKALLTGEVDVIMGVPPQTIDQIEKNPETQVASVPALRIIYFTFNTLSPNPFSDLKVRLAANYAIDAEAIRKTILGGRADLIGQLYHPWVYSGYNPKMAWYGHDPEKAKALMKESGYPDGFKTELYSPIGRYPGDVATCEAVAGMLKKINIDTTCRPTAYTLYTQLRKNYQSGKTKGPAMFLQGFGNSAGDPALATRATVSCKGAFTAHCFKDLDDAIDKAAATVDPDKQQAAYEKVTDIIKEMALIKVLFKIHDVYGFRKGIKFYPRHDETIFPWEIVAK